MREDGHPVHKAYLDFQKIFNKVGHQMLFKELFYDGIRSKSFTWPNKNLKVGINDIKFSAYMEVASGVQCAHHIHKRCGKSRWLLGWQSLTPQSI